MIITCCRCGKWIEMPDDSDPCPAIDQHYGRCPRRQETDDEIMEQALAPADDD